MTRRVSLDLETLGTSADAPIVQIGYALFDIDAGTIGASGCVYVRPMDLGGAQVDTIAWWLVQSDEARERMRQALLTGVHPAMALAVLSRAIAGCAEVWGNGATFDVAILEQTWAKYGQCARPWTHRAVRDMRTIVEAAEVLRGFDKSSIPFVGVEHDAGHDAEHQAKVISAAWAALRA